MDPHAAPSLLVIFTIAALTPILVDLPKGIRVPGVVAEIILGIIVGPQELGWVHTGEVVNTFAEFGLAMLIFLAGFEIDIQRIKGRPITLALTAWGFSLAVGLAVGGILAASGFAISSLVIGLALTTTALGTLLPILADAGELGTPFGAAVLAGGAVGEVCPIVAIALLLASNNPASTVLVLLAFVALIMGAIWLALRPRPQRLGRLLSTTLHTSGQLAVRLCLLLLAALVWLASELDLDVLLGAFGAGLVVRIFLERPGNDPKELHDINERLSSIGYGLFIPLFFVVTGVRFDLDALFGSPTTVLRVPLFLALFVLARGVPSWIVHRKDLPRDQLLPYSLMMSTALPLVVVITTIGLDTNRMKPENAAALVGAGLLSVMVMPTIALRMRDRGPSTSPTGLSADPAIDPAIDPTGTA